MLRHLFNFNFNFRIPRLVALISFALLLVSPCRADTSDRHHEASIHIPESTGNTLNNIQPNISIVIATTVLHPDATLPAWLDYHLRWAHHVVIYMDDPNERSTLERLCKEKPVTLMAGSQVEPNMTPESRLIERQLVNMQHAIDHLTPFGYTWLLHIDLDELLYGPLIDSKAWSTDPELGLVTFTNHEALPVAFETTDPFRECVYFWVNGVDHNRNFMAYGNGKSAVRLGPDVKPLSAHSFEGFTGRVLTPSGRDAMVLHYPHPSYESWLRKFDHYGNFPDHWFGDRRAPMIMDFMRQSRDLVQRAHETDDWAEVEAFFTRRVLDDASRDQALAEGKIRRYEPFAEIKKE